ncbi:phosphatase PAP2 family protein [Streptomyces sp. BE133]|uniref:phosphatase PAP2 family protein n=1 Tax=Streptomyces sp. BE133 TaxID=3002523 RepID=UPI002E771B34|nr:phosphatase PAP2 family protein [Streptomyces sp. BE133]MEE1809472.1 phosphatase PAP2 family protein [Streptomyces sp. BE133]
MLPTCPDPQTGSAPAPRVAERPESLRLSLRAFLLVCGLSALPFTLITWQVVTDGPLLGVDERISHALIHPNRVSELLSDLGNGQVAVPSLALVAMYVAWRGRATGTGRWWLPPLVAAVLMALVPAIIMPLKEWTGRHGTPVVPPGGDYYPSGHTATAAVAYGSAALLLLPWLRSARTRLTLLAACAALVLGVSFGLVRQGYHWPLDVVASWFLCGLLLLPLGLSCRSRRRSSSRTPRC